MESSIADKNVSIFPLYFAIPIEKDKWNGSFDFKLNCRTLYLICFFKAKASSSDLSFAKITNSSPPGSLTLAHSQNSQMSFMYGFFFVKFLFFTVVCVVIVI